MSYSKLMIQTIEILIIISNPRDYETKVAIIAEYIQMKNEKQYTS